MEPSTRGSASPGITINYTVNDAKEQPHLAVALVEFAKTTKKRVCVDIVIW
jgi:hypothetical protein